MKLILVSKILLFFTFAFAQVPTSVWQQTIGGSGIDGVLKYEDPTSNEYFLIGFSDSDVSGDKTEPSRGFTDIWIVKMSATHTAVWDKTIGGDGFDFVDDVLITNNRLYILCRSNSGVSGEKTIAPFSTMGSYDQWLVCCDLLGNIQWQEQYGGDAMEGYGELISLSNGNILIGMTSESGVSGNKTEAVIGGKDLWFVEIDPLNGSIQNQATIGSNDDDEIKQLLLNSAGNLIVPCSSQFGSSGDKTDAGFGASDIWIIELDQNLNVLSDHCFGGTEEEDYFGGRLIEYNSSYYLAANSSSGVSGNKTAPYQGSFDGFEHSDYWVLKLNLNFDVIWDVTFGGTADDNCNGVFYNEWNKLVVYGRSESGVSGNKTAVKYGGTDVWLVVIDLDGNEIVQGTYGGSDLEGGVVYPIEGDPRSLYVASTSLSGISGNKTVGTNGSQDTWLFELDASAVLTNEEIGSFESLVLYPNPCDGNCNYQLDISQQGTINISDNSGRLIKAYSMETGSNKIRLNDLPEGTYFITVISDGEILKSSRLIKL